MISCLTISSSEFSIENSDASPNASIIIQNSNTNDSNSVNPSKDAHTGLKKITVGDEMVRSMQFIAKRSWNETQVRKEEVFVREKFED